MFYRTQFISLPNWHHPDRAKVQLQIVVSFTIKMHQSQSDHDYSVEHKMNAPKAFSCISVEGTISRTNSRGPIRRRTASFVWPELFPDSDSDSTRTSLLVAAFNGKEDKVRELLLRDDVNPNISYSNGKY